MLPLRPSVLADTFLTEKKTETSPPSHSFLSFPKSVMETERNQLRIFGQLGLLAAVLVGIGEFLLHYSATGYGGGEYSYLRHVTAERVTIGHFLLVFGLPFYFAGYWFIYQTLGPSRWALAVLVTGFTSFVIGGVWVSSRAMLIQLVQVRAGTSDPEALQILIDFYGNHYEILVQVLRILVLLLSVFWVMAILKTKTIFPRWMAVASPIALLVLVFLSFLAVPAFGKYLVPTAMNVAHLVFFGLAYFYFLKNEKTGD